MTTKFQKNLRNLRTEYKVTQEDLDYICGFAKGTIAQYENGTRTPGLENLYKIRKGLSECSWEEILD